ncbi:MaoC/PaaZ C-terminal domain-containing protein [Actinokineospora enzanensis]|uniref:MaoC/PaaZ C-terminal domain-containing protein n=1 Tax=Actinokineospora enzanensis TaxID=155975 RepID=UPI0009FBBD8C|nr:MaoC/PaaZ C-terminal domain-containing protein [Actinokineospora enzanensis]
MELGVVVGALAGFAKRGGELPGRVVERQGVRVDPSRLAAYGRVCGFRVADELPVTYPHVLAFPLQMRLMAGRDFPYPVMGVVHVANRIVQHRPLLVGELLDLRVRAEDARPHPKGTQFDVVSEVISAGAVVWEDRSTYLWRRAGKSEKAPREPVELPASVAVWEVPRDIGRRYAAVSGDHNPIHLHPLTARLFGFPCAIAHGMWSKARCLAAFEGRLADAFAVEVGFKLPLLLPATVRFHAGGDMFALADVNRLYLTGRITL